MEYLIHPKGKLVYKKKGIGPEMFLIFHGFGQNHQDMLPLDEIRMPNQCFLFIDMFYHGRSQWFDSLKNLDRATWVEIIRMLQIKENFTQFNLIGYSMGGKFSMLTYELFVNEVKSLTLLAPDGIKTGLWYSMTNYPNFIHPVFKRMIFKPNRFFGIIDGLNSAGLVEKSFVKFVKTQLETRSHRAQAYFVWKVFGGIQLHLGQIIRLARNHQTPITLFIGSHDKMVTAENLDRFSKKIPHLKNVELPVGHGQLIEAAVEYLMGER
ncbi:alpha/beta fold hydrolase [Algoriphagus sp.]|uniref:alpha/beta fold hydrolase n=1 Tax=Algoriphagus sp. TaxID=1872435 RepID=UPI0039194957